MKKYIFVLFVLLSSFVLQSCWQLSNDNSSSEYNNEIVELKNLEDKDFQVPNQEDLPYLQNLDDKDFNIDNKISNNSNYGIDKNGEYTDKESVALYIHTYNCLPKNYITKKDAQNLGWNSKKGNLNKIAPGKSIGGSSFGNYEGNLPKKNGRKYFECDIDYNGGHRNAKRIVYSNDGLIYYTDDHYNTFEKLY